MRGIDTPHEEGDCVRQAVSILGSPRVLNVTDRGCILAHKNERPPFDNFISETTRRDHPQGPPLPKSINIIISINYKPRDHPQGPPLKISETTPATGGGL